MKKKIFKKVLVNERLPNKSCIVDTNLGELKFYVGTQDFTIVNKTKIDGSDDRLPKWWFEEVNLGDLKFDKEEATEEFVDGINYVLDKL